MLAVTCTDMAVLAGNHGEACYAKYGSLAIRGEHCHEMAVRIVLASIASHAARYKRYIGEMSSKMSRCIGRNFVFSYVFTVRLCMVENLNS